MSLWETGLSLWDMPMDDDEKEFSGLLEEE